MCVTQLWSISRRLSFLVWSHCQHSTSTENQESCFILVKNHQQCRPIPTELRRKPGTNDREPNTLAVTLAGVNYSDSSNINMAWCSSHVRHWISLTILHKNGIAVRRFHGFKWQVGCLDYMKNHLEIHIKSFTTANYQNSKKVHHWYQAGSS